MKALIGYREVNFQFKKGAVMRKLSLSLLLTIFISAGTWSQEFLTPLNGGDPVDAGIPDNAVMMENKNGVVFLVSIKENTLFVLTSINAGDSFTEYPLSFLDSSGFSQFRYLTLYEQSYKDWAAFFIARKDGDDHLCALEFDNAGELELLSGGMLDSTSVPGEITGYEIHPDKEGGYYILYIKEGLLYRTYIDKTKQVYSAVLISEHIETVQSFFMKEKIYPAGDIRHYGMYISSAGAEKKITYVEFMTGGAIVSREVKTTGIDISVDYQIEKNDNDETICILTIDGKMYAYKITNTGIQNINAGNPVRESPGIITKCELFLYDNKPYVLFLTRNDIWEGIYGIMIDEQGNVENLHQGVPFNTAGTDDFTLFQYRKDMFFYGFLEEHGIVKKLRIFTLTPYHRTWHDLSFNLDGTAKNDSISILDFSFAELSGGDFVITAMVRNGTEYRQKIYALSEDEETLSFTRDVSVEVMDEDFMQGRIAGDCLYLHTDTDSFFFIDFVRNQSASYESSHIVPVKGQDGRYFIIAAEASDSSLLFSLPKPGPPPEGALWTTGSPLGSWPSFCRIYSGENAGGQDPGTIEVQQKHSLSIVRLDGIVQPGTEEQTRYFTMDSGEEKVFTVEVWSLGKRKGIYRYNVESTIVKNSRKNTMQECESAAGSLLDNLYSKKEFLFMDLFTLPFFASYVPPVDKEDFNPLQLSDSRGIVKNPAVGDGMAVWQGYDGHDWEIFLWQAGQVTRITDNELDDTLPRATEGKVFWIQDDGSDPEIFMWEEGTGITRVTENDVDDRNIRVSNGVCIWQEYDNGDYEIWLMNNGQPERITDNDYNESFIHLENIITETNSTTVVAWSRRKYKTMEVMIGQEDQSMEITAGIPQTEIITWTKTYSTSFLLENLILSGMDFDGTSFVLLGSTFTTSPFEHQSPQIYSLENNQFDTITATDTDKGSPGINDNTIVWQETTDEGFYHIFMYRGITAGILSITSSLYHNINPVVSENNLIVWQESYGENNCISYFNYRNTSVSGSFVTSYDARNHDADHGFIVWQEDDGDTSSIYGAARYDIKSPKLSISLTIPGEEVPLEEGIWTNAYMITAQATADDYDANYYYESFIDMNSWQYSLDGEYWTNVDGSEEQSYPVDLAPEGEGDFTVYSRVSDTTGNIGTAKSFVRIDHTPPSIRDSDIPDWTNEPEYEVNAAADDALSGVAGDTWHYLVKDTRTDEVIEEGDSPYVTIQREGKTTVTFTVKDIAGNEGKRDFQVNIDNTLPEVTNIMLNPGVLMEHDIILTGRTFTAEEGLIEIAAYNTITTRGDCVVEDGANVTFVMGEHVNINEGFAVRPGGEFTIQMEYHQGDWVNAKSVKATASARDDLSGIAEETWEYRVQGEKWVPAYIADIKDQGETIVYFRVCDKAGNRSEEKSITIKIDREPPFITATGTLENTWSGNREFKAKVTAGDGEGSGVSSLFYRIFPGEDEPGPWEELLPLPDPVSTLIGGFSEGKSIIEVKAVDRTGLFATTSAEVWLDFTPPEIVFPGDWTDGTIVAEVKDQLSGVDASSLFVSKNGEVYSPGNTLVFAESGMYPVWVKAKDNTGNGTVGSGEVKVDKTPPDITVEVEEDLVNGRFFIKATAVDSYGIGEIDEASWGYRLNDGPLQPGHRVEVTTRDHTIYFEVKDMLGNKAFVQQAIRLDNTPPDIYTTETGWTNAGLMYASARASDNPFGSGVNPAGWAYQLNTTAGTWIQISGITDPDAEVKVPVSKEGLTIVYFKVADFAGNESTASTIIRIDRTPPVFTGFTYYNDNNEILGSDGQANVWTNSSSVTLIAGVSDSREGVDTSGVESVLWSFDDTLPETGWEKSDRVTITNEGRSRIYFRGKDNAGNVSEAVRYVHIDRSGPVIKEGLIDDTYVKDILCFTEMPMAIDELSGVSPETLEYSFDAADASWAAVSGEIDVSFLTEGIHTLCYRVYDYAGNHSVIQAGSTFTVDKTPPVITDLVLYAGEKILEETDFSPFNSVRVDIDASDTYGDTLEGEIAGYSWELFITHEDSPLLTHFTLANQDFSLTSLDNGLYYFYVKAVDEAGNESSEAWERIIRVDAIKPGIPVIKGLSHPRAIVPEDAVALKDALFMITPTTAGDSGIAGYSYELRSGLDEQSAIILETGTVAGGRIEFPGLPDNEVNEFYFLLVKVTGGNRIESDRAVFSFRIDSTPPQNLDVESVSHPNPELYYPSENLVLKWNKPLDFTGVKSYYWKLSTESLLPEPLPEDYQHEGEWTETTARTLTKNLMDIIEPGGGSEKGAGTVYACVCALDFAGNRQYDQTIVRFDTVKPEVDADSITIETDKPERKADVFWQIPTDNTGLSHTELRLALLNNDNSVTYLSNTIIKSNDDVPVHTFRGLNPDDSVIYVLFFTGVDTAGNRTTMVKGFSFSGLPVTINISIPFTATIKGYTIEGKYSADPSLQEARILVPSSLHLYTQTDPPEYPDAINLTELEFSTEGEFIAGSNPGISFNAEIAGYDIAGTGLSITKTRGLVFHELTFTTIIDMEDTEKSFHYTDVAVSSPPEILFAPGFMKTEDPAFSFQSVRSPSDPGSPDPPAEPGWLFSGIRETGFENDSWVAGLCQLDLTLISDKVCAYLLDQDDNKVFTIPLEKATISPQRTTREGEFTGRFYLEAAGNLFYIRNAFLRENRIIIIEAEVIFPPEITEDEVIIKNFSIDIDGNIHEEPGFSVSPFQFTSGDITFTVDTIHFIGNSLVITSGKLTCNDMAFLFNNLVLTCEGVDYDTPAEIPGFSGVYSGFTVTSDPAYLLQDGIWCPRAWVHMPESFGGEKQEITGLIVSLSENTVLQTGEGSTQFEIATAYAADPGSGNNITVEKIALTPDGLYASEFTVPVPGFLQPSVEVIRLKNLPMISDGTVGNSEKSDGEIIEITIAGFTFSAYEFVFNGDVLILGKIDFLLPDNYSPSLLTFENLSVNMAGIASPGLVISPVHLLSSGWHIILKDLTVDDNGITGMGEVQLPEEFAYRIITFPGFTLFPDGSYTTGLCTEDTFFSLSGWTVKANGLSLEQETIHISNTDVLLYSIMGGGALSIPDIVINSSGEIVSSGEGTGSTDFFAVNGFSVTAERFTIKPDGIKLGGKVYFPPALGEVYASFGKEEILLESDGCIITQEKSGPVEYDIAGWSISAENFRFDRQGLYVGKSTIDFFDTGVKADIPDIWFYADGSIKLGGVSFDGFELPVFGFTLGVTTLYLSDEGLTIKAFINLPPNLGTESIYFDKLTLHPDGRITSEVVVRDFMFDLFDFHFQFRNIRFDESGFSIEKGIVTLPGGILGSKNIGIQNFKIGNDGSFEVEGLGLDPFHLWGYTFLLKSIGFKDNVVSFSGSIRLPSDFFITELAGRELVIEKFSVSLEGEVLDFKVVLEGEYRFTLFKAWTVIINSISIENSWFRIESGTLIFPEGFGIDSIEVGNIAYNVETSELIIGEITLENIPLHYEGFTFVINKLIISGERGLVLSGFTIIPECFPFGLAGRVLTIDVFQIKPDFTVGDIALSLSGFNTPLFDGFLYLENGTLGFSGMEEDLILSVNGTLILDSRFPAGFGGKKLHINAFKIRTNDGKITAFDAETDPFPFPLFGIAEVEDARIKVTYAEETDHFAVDVSGDIVLSGNFPDSLENKRISITAFNIDTNGTITRFAAGLTLPGETGLFGDIFLLDATVNAILTPDKDGIQFDVTGKIRFGPGFPDGIAGLEADINKLCFDTLGNIISLDVNVHLTQFGIFGLTVKNGKVHLALSDDGDILTSVSGDVILPPDFPEGFANLVVSISKFTIASTGEIKELDMGFKGLNTTLFGGISLQDGELTVSADSGDELIFSCAGKIILPPGLPGDFAGLKLVISKCRISSREGLLDFRAKTESNITIDFLAGLVLEFKEIQIDMEGISMNGSLTFPSIFPEGLAGMVLVFSNLKLGWDGSVIDIQAGIGHISVNLAGFTADFYNLEFNSKGISLESCILTLPPALESKKVGVKNAGFDWDGRFYGDIIVPTLDFPFAGFHLFMHSPSLDVEKCEISFTRVDVDLPPIVGGRISLSGVRLSPEGLKITGGSFKLPDFTIAGGLGFRDVMVAFSLSDGGGYFVAGQGEMLIPGLGSFRADVSFVNRSKDYPIGIKRAYFEYTVYGIGIPVGGLVYLNAIRGGIAFGPPDELPGQVQGMFANGTRLQLGVTLTGPYGGSLVKGDADFWIDVSNWGIAFKGQVTVLNGIVSGTLITALTNRGFYGDFSFRIVFVKGQIKLYIFPYHGRTMVSGSGKFQFGLPKGCILKIKIKILWWKIKIYIPPWDIWLFSIGGEFGLFKNGHEGFKGWIDFGIFGRLGVFVGKGRFKLGNVSEYELYNPFETQAQRSSGMPGIDSSGIDSNRSIAVNKDYQNENRRVFAMDEIISGNRKTDRYRFIVPGKGMDRGRGRYVTTPSLTSTLMLRNTTADVQDDQNTEVERIVFMLGYIEGDPALTAIAPSGTRFSPGDPGVLVERQEWGLLMAVTDPEPGEWNLEVSGVVSDDSYVVKAFEKTKVPEIRLDTPAVEKEHVDASITVAGNAMTHNGTRGDVVINRSFEKDSYIGEPMAETTANENGDFSIIIDTSSWKAGEYWLFASVSVDDGPETKAYAPGSIVVSGNQDELLAVENLIAADNGNGGIDISFTDPNGEHTKGYYVMIENLSAGEGDIYEKSYEEVWIGSLTGITLPGYREGDEIRLAVKAVDYMNRDGIVSGSVTIVMGEEKEIINVFSFTEKEVSLDIMIGQLYDGTLHFTVDNAQSTGTAYDYLEVAGTQPGSSIEELENQGELSSLSGISFHFDNSMWNLAGGEGDVDYSIRADVTMSPGEYRREFYFKNRGNRDITEKVVFTITLNYPPVAVSSITPDTLDRKEGTELVVYGDNFYAGTRLFLDENELVIYDSADYYLRATIDPGLETGEHTIRVTGPGGDEVIQTITVTEPTYAVLGYKTKSVIQPGETVRFYFTIIGEEGFEDTVQFHVEDIPAGWNTGIDHPVIGHLQTASVEVMVPELTAPGEYVLTLVSEDGDELPLQVTVSETPSPPVITGLSTYSGFAGDELSIYGYGFGKHPVVKLHNTEVPVISSSPDSLLIAIPAHAESGDIIVGNDGLVSNGVAFTVKQYGFTLYAETETVRLHPGETSSVKVFVSGYAPSVTLDTTVYDPGIATGLDKAEVIPNDVCLLTLFVPGNTANGEYEVLLNGTYSDYTAQTIIKLIVTDAFCFITEELPQAFEGVSYCTEVKTLNHRGQVTYSLEDGQLPPGLVVSQGGAISGTPAGTGSFNFTLTATDSDAKMISREFTLSVQENNWSHTNKNSGRTRYNPVQSPADNRKKWTSTSYPGFTGTEETRGRTEILTGTRRIFVVKGNKILGLDRETGSVMFLYQSVLQGTIRQSMYHEGILFVLEDNGTFQAVDALFGNLKWQRDKVTRFALVDTTLYLGSEAKIQLVDASNGMLKAEINAALPDTGILFVCRETLYWAFEENLHVLDENGWQNVYSETGQIISDAAADEKNIVLSTEQGKLIILDPDINKTGEIQTGPAGARVVLKENNIILAGGNEMISFERESLEHVFTSTREVDEIAAALEKVFVLNKDTLAAINGYDGTTIWESAGSYSDSALAGECLYAVSPEGIVTCYNAPSNIYPPVTTIHAFPAEPDGENGYYITQPTVDILAHDQESYVEETLFRYTTGDFTPYTESFILPDGEYSLIYYSVDNHHYREPDRISFFKIDTFPPLTAFIAAGAEGDNHYHISPVTVSLKAEDMTSGINLTEYRINDSGWTTYSKEILLSEEGEYSISWRSTDIAGNYETEQHRNITIDLHDPEVEASVRIEPGIGIITITTSDSFSGIRGIEYRIDDGIIQAYEGTIPITSPGKHTVYYRAYDNAGRYSTWQDITFDITDAASVDWIEDLRFSYYLPWRRVVRNIQAGDTLYAPYMGWHNRIAALPGYLAGADYIRLHIADRVSRSPWFITFTAGIDCDVYIMKHKASCTDLTGWELVEKNYPVEPHHFFRGGADVYKKQFKTGDRVIIPGSYIRGYGFSNLVFVQYAQSNTIKLYSPLPGTEFIPLDTIRFAGTVLQEGDFTYQWEVKYGEGEWNSCGHGLSGELTLPYTEDERAMYLKFSATGRDISLSTEKEYLIKNHGDIRLFFPVPGGELLSGESIPLDYSASGVSGEPAGSSQVIWYKSRDGLTWDTLVSQPGNTLAVPETPGDYYLKAILMITEAIFMERSFSFTVVESLSPVKIVFGIDESENPCTAGETFTYHENGLAYGFNTDHTDNCRIFFVAGHHHHKEKYTNIRLKPGGSFDIACRNGFYNVSILAGPINAWETTGITIEGCHVPVKGHWYRSLQIVTGTVRVNDRTLTIQGNPGLPLVWLSIEHLAPDEVAETGFAIETVKGVMVFEDYPSCGRKKDRKKEECDE
ncbi:MAG: IPT/TIG domain-containing protein [Spirochaetales bacterium]|nr:IPT/TIG domain-containing protein [Spirochaetales bacterium]